MTFQICIIGIQIVFAATSLSDPQKIKPDEQKTIRRIEWGIHRMLLEKKSELYRVPVFSDYGVDFSNNLAPRRGIMPSAKINYTTDDGHYYVKGQNVKTAGYEAIYPVADTIVASTHFKGEKFSAGDARIWLLNQRRTGTGNAPTWRWAATDHHLSMVGKSLAIELGIKLSIPTDAGSENLEQPDLLSLIPAK